MSRTRGAHTACARRSPLALRWHVIVGALVAAALAAAAVVAVTGTAHASGSDWLDTFTDDEGNEVVYYDTTWYTQADDGTTEFTIGTAAELAGLAYLVNNSLAFNTSDFDDCTITLANDIEIPTIVEDGDYVSWAPIGYRLSTASGNDGYKAFRGTFDGDGHTVSGLAIYEWTSTMLDGYVGLFGKTWYATIENLTVEGEVTGTYSSSSRLGGIVGSDTGSTISNCTSAVTLTDERISRRTSTWSIGGIVGAASSSTLVTGCTFTGTINVYASADVGGIIGESGTAEYCTNEGTITNLTTDAPGTTYQTNEFCVGGIGGSGCSVSYCTNSGAITLQSDYTGGSYTQYRSVGGICGTGQVSGCVNTGTVTGRYMCAGGILGIGYSSSNKNSWTVEDCRNEGSVYGSQGGRGGIVGYAMGVTSAYYATGARATIRNCYNIGSCTYGIVGTVSSSAHVFTCEGLYYLSSSSTYASSSSVIEATAVDADGLCEAGVALAEASENWYMNLTGYKSADDEVLSGYPLLVWETDASATYLNIDGTKTVGRVAFAAGAAVGNAELAAIYTSYGFTGTQLTASGTVPAGYELNTENLAWVDGVKSETLSEHAAGDATVTYATGIWLADEGTYDYEPIEYSIEYVGLLGLSTDNPASYTVESATIALSAPYGSSDEATGKTFLGWADVSEAGGEVESTAGYTLVSEIATGSTGELVLQAVWTDATSTYTISYPDPDGTTRTALLAAGCSYTAGSADAVTPTADVELAAPSGSPDAGYQTLGYTACYDSAGNLVLTVGSGSPIAYTLSYSLNEGTYPFDANPTSMTVADTVVLVTPVREGLEFWGWTLDADESGAYVTEITGDDLLEYAEESEDGAGDWTLCISANWPVYSITYKNVDYLYTINDGNPSEYMAGDEIELNDPERYGCTFEGWYLTEDFSGEAFTGITADTRGALVLYAKWSITTYTVELDLNDDDEYADVPATSVYEGGLVLEDGTTACGFTYTCEDEDDIFLEDPQREGLDFKGWYDTDGRRVYVIFGGGLTHEDMQLSATWALASYSITYVLNGGTVVGGTGEWLTSYDISTAAVDLSSYEQPTREGYTFVGWYLYEEDEDGTVALGDTLVTSVAGGSTGDIVLGAKWEAVEYTISYELNGGSWGDATPVTGYTVDGIDELIEPVRDGYEFGGFYDNAAFEGEAITSIAAGTTGDITLYAKWEELSAEEASIPTVQATESGTVTVQAPEEFANAEIVDLTTELSAGGEYTTSAVVAEHELTFYAEESGSYTVEQSSYPTTYTYDGYDGMDVWSNMSMLSTTRYVSDLDHTLGRQLAAPNIVTSIMTQGGLSLSNSTTNVSNGAAIFVPYKGVSKESADEVSYGSEEDPIALLVHFVGVGEESEGTLEMTRPTSNAMLGYSSNSTTSYKAIDAVRVDGESPLEQETEFDPTWLVAEDRDEDTGRLLASVLFAPSEESSPVDYGEGGGNAFNLVLDPSEELLLERLSTHSAYEEEGTDVEADAAAIAAAEGDDVLILANLDSMVAYNTGGKLYTLDIATLSDGRFEAGDTLRLSYVAASDDANAYSGDTIAYYEALLQATDMTLEVDEDGYIAFTLYGGGVYALAIDDADVAATVDAMAASLTITDDAAEADADDADGTGTAASAVGVDTTGISADEVTADASTQGTTVTRIVKRVVTTTVSVPAASSTGSSSGSSAVSGISIDVDDDDDGIAETAEANADAATDNVVVEGDDGAAQDDGDDNPLLNEDGTINWGTIVPLLVVLGVLLVGTLVLWLLFARKKDEDEDEDEDDGQPDEEAPLSAQEAAAAAAAAAAQVKAQAAAQPATPGGLGSAATHAVMAAGEQAGAEAAQEATGANG